MPTDRRRGFETSCLYVKMSSSHPSAVGFFFFFFPEGEGKEGGILCQACVSLTKW